MCKFLGRYHCSDPSSALQSVAQPQSQSFRWLSLVVVAPCQGPEAQQKQLQQQQQQQQQRDHRVGVHCHDGGDQQQQQRDNGVGVHCHDPSEQQQLQQQQRRQMKETKGAGLRLTQSLMKRVSVMLQRQEIGEKQQQQQHHLSLSQGQKVRIVQDDDGVHGCGS